MGCSATAQSNSTDRRQAESTRESLPRSGHTQARSTQVPFDGGQSPLSNPGLPPRPLPARDPDPSQAPLPIGCSCGPLTLRFHQGSCLGRTGGLARGFSAKHQGAFEQRPKAGAERGGDPSGRRGGVPSLSPPHFLPAGVGARGAALGRRQRFFVSLAQVTRH